MIETSFVFIAFVIFLAFAFDFTNGFHDAGNSIATIVATGVLTPRQAVLWAAFFNFMAFLLFKLAVADTVGTGLIKPSIVTPYLVFAALSSAIIWNLATWYMGLPSSSSHALIGGLAGAAFAKAGIVALEFSGFAIVLIAICLSPIMGLLIAAILNFFVTRIAQRYNEKTRLEWFKNLQLLSSALLSLMHGSNDAQKTMGVIALLLFSGALLDHFYIPFWVVLSCYLVIALGTLMGGWRIVHTMGQKITQLNPARGCCAETAAASVIFVATDLGIPISTTHTVTGAISGVGLSGSFGGINWSIMRKILAAWFLTIPATALLAALIMKFNILERFS